jgi:DNA-binding transcriptional ArsR family regulator
MDVELLKALADGTRLGMLRRIAKAEVCACELPATAKTSQPAVSQHLAVLREAGLVQVRKDGVKRLYSISGKGRKILAQISKW